MTVEKYGPSLISRIVPVAEMILQMRKRYKEFLIKRAGEQLTLMGFPIEWKDDMPPIGDIILGDFSCWTDDKDNGDQDANA